MITFYNSKCEIVNVPKDADIRWRVSAYAFVRNPEGKILLMKGVHSHRWELPGGGLEIGEHLHDAIIREVYEETGYKITVDMTKPLYVGECGWNKRDTGEFFQCIYSIFPGKLALDVPDSHVVNHIGPIETEEVAWVNPSELTAENCHPNFYPFLKRM